MLIFEYMLIFLLILVCNSTELKFVTATSQPRDKTSRGSEAAARITEVSITIYFSFSCKITPSGFLVFNVYLLN